MGQPPDPRTRVRCSPADRPAPPAVSSSRSGDATGRHGQRVCKHVGSAPVTPAPAGNARRRTGVHFRGTFSAFQGDASGVMDDCPGFASIQFLITFLSHTLCPVAGKPFRSQVRRSPCEARRSGLLKIIAQVFSVPGKASPTVGRHSRRGSGEGFRAVRAGGEHRNRSDRLGSRSAAVRGGRSPQLGESQASQALQNHGPADQQPADREVVRSNAGEWPPLCRGTSLPRQATLER